MKNKKAQEDSTITWVVAIFIIVFILMIYLVITFSMDIKNSLNWKGEMIDNEVYYLQDLAGSQTLFSILNSEIKFKDKNTNIMNAILDSFDIYFETKNPEGKNLVEMYGLHGSEDISGTAQSKMLEDGFSQADIEIINAQNQELADEIKKIVDSYCSKYRLAIPQGVINEGNELSVENSFYFSFDDLFPAEWTPTVGFIIKYRGAMMSIKFTELKECSQSTRLDGQKNSRLAIPQGIIGGD